MPADTTIEGQAVRKGTWMLALRINDDDVWARIRNGELSGLSITGVATITPLDSRISTESVKGAQVHMLSDFDVREVHIVDLAANKRRFPVTKRSDPLAETNETRESDEPELPAANDDKETEQTPTEASEPSVSDDVAALRGVIAELVSAATALRSAVAPPPAPAATPEPDTSPKPVRAEVVKSLVQCIVRLEKAVPMPASEGGESPSRVTAHAWPYDINGSDESHNGAGGQA